MTRATRTRRRIRPSGSTVRRSEALPEIDARLYEDIFRSLHFGLAVWQLEDRDDERTFRLVALNPAVERISQRKVEELVGARMVDGFPRLFATDMPRAYAEVVRSGKARNLGVMHYGDDVIPEGYYTTRAFPLPDDHVGTIYERVDRPPEAGRDGGKATKLRDGAVLKQDHGLTQRELTILYFVAAGRTDKETARELGISPLTVQKHVSNILRKMKAASRTEASVLAFKSGLLF